MLPYIIATSCVRDCKLIALVLSVYSVINLLQYIKRIACSHIKFYLDIRIYYFIESTCLYFI